MTHVNPDDISPQPSKKPVASEWVQAVGSKDVNDEDDLFARSSDEEEPDFVDEAKIPEAPEAEDELDGDKEYEEFTSRSAMPEEAPARRPKNPADPTPEEKERHMCSHLPYRPWCPICVKARGREDQHYERTKEQRSRGVPKMAMDYAETGEMEDRSDARKLLIGRDRWTKYTFGHLVRCKGLGDERIVKKVCQSMGETGFTKMALKGDGEPALVQIQEEVKAKRMHETILENPPAHDPQANGEAERAVQEVKAQIRCVRLGLEARIGGPVDAGQPVMEWLIPHSSDLINRYLVGDDGRTAHYRIHEKMFTAKVYEFGEQVLALLKRKQQTARKTSLATRWKEATWVGFSTRTNEHIVVVNDGGPAIKVRTLRPRPESERWSEEAINKIVATPDAPNPKDPSQTEPKGPRETDRKGARREGGHELPEVPVRRDEGLVREFRITDKLIEKYGFTPGCPGCEAKIDGTTRAGHTQACRRRIETAMANDEVEKAALQRRDERRAKHDADRSSQPEARDQPAQEEQQEEDVDDDVEMGTDPNEDIPVEEGMNDATGGDDEAEAESSGDELHPVENRTKRQRIEAIEIEGDGIDVESREPWLVPADEAAAPKLPSGVQAWTSRRKKIEGSVKSVMEKLIRAEAPMVNQLCTYDIMKRMIDELDAKLTRKTMKRLKKIDLKEKKANGENEVDVAEAFSPPRMAAMATRLGYKSGFSLDLTGQDEEGRTWDLSDKVMQDAALDLLDKHQPHLLVVSPPCTWFSTLMNLNIGKMQQEHVWQNLEQAIGHVAFAVLLCMRQAAAGRKYVFEHPAGASSWAMGIMNKLYIVADGVRVTFDFCMLGMTSKDEQGEAPVMKKTAVVTNSKKLAEALRQCQCDHSHRHVVLLGGKAKACQRYPDEFCELVCKTVMEEKNQLTYGSINSLTNENKQNDISDITEYISALVKEDMPTPHEDLYENYDFVDDVTGKDLDGRLAAAARRLEMDFFRRKQVYKKVPRYEAQGKVVSTKWIDINKGDAQNPNYRARLVGREIKTDKRLDLFAATPPLESLRMVSSMCASNQRRSQPYRILSIDIKRAYFYAPAERPVYIEIPVEDYQPGDENLVGKLELSLYGTRDAAQNWAKEYTTFLEQLGFAAGAASPCNFVNEGKEVFVTVHGDDFTATGPQASLEWFEQKMTGKYEIKSDYLGPEPGQHRELRVLNRVLRWADRGIEYEPDQRHSEIITKSMGMENSKPVNTPSVSDDKQVQGMRENSRVLNKAEATEYRALAARLNYLALDRMDLQFTAKLVSRHMANPVEHDWLAMKRVARYLVGKPRFTQVLVWQDPPHQLLAYSDSDWAGDKLSRKSTSGGLVMAGSHVIKSWSSTQQVVALSSGEAELYALIKTAAQTKGIMSGYMDFGLKLDCIVHTDANAAMGIVHRLGLGRTRHIEVQYLWIQKQVYDRDLEVRKVGTHDNPADLLTKSLSQDVMEKHLYTVHCETASGRAESAPHLNAVGEDGDIYGGVNDGGHREIDSWTGPPQGPTWIRHHAKARNKLFTPMRVIGGPKDHTEVGELRVTTGTYVDGTNFHVVDNWRCARQPHRSMRMPWLGTTTFERIPKLSNVY